MSQMTEKTEPRETYHHGALREALLAAAEQEIAESGVENFSLRRVAKRAGVSHAAPAHHFGDAQGLLTALAAMGYRRFVQTQIMREEAAGRDPIDILMGAGLGYIDFAMENPALFRLIFSSDRPDYSNKDLEAAGTAAFAHLCDQVTAILGKSPDDDPDVMLETLTIWSTVHGLADLLVAGRMTPLQALTGPARDAAVAKILRRSFPNASRRKNAGQGAGQPSARG